MNITFLNKALKALIVILLLIGTSALSAFSIDTIRVGIYQNPPKLYVNESGAAAGIYVDLLREIARQEGWELSFRSADWQSLMTAISQGNIDIMPDVAFSVQRSDDYDFNKITVLESWSQIYTRPRKEILNFSDLNGKRMALLKGSIQERAFTELMNGYAYDFTKISANSFEEAFVLVKEDFADAVIVNYFYGANHARQYGLKTSPLILNPASLHFIVQKGKHGELLETIDAYLSQWKKEPHSFYYQTLRAYLDPISPEKKSGCLPWILALTIIFCVIALLIFFLRRQSGMQFRNLLRINAKLKQEESKFSSYIQHAPFGVFVSDAEGHYIEVNNAACRITGYTPEELLETSIPDLLSPDSQKAGMGHFKEVCQSGSASGILKFRHKNGDVRYWSVEAVRISGERILAFVDDVTEKELYRKRVELLSKITEFSVNEIYLFDAETLRFVEANHAALQNTGYSAEEIRSMTPLHLKKNLKSKQFEEILAPLKNKKEKHIVFETQHFRKDGSAYDAELHLQMIEQNDRVLISAVALDISDRKQAERELWEIKEKLEKEVGNKTRELQEHIKELEEFREATINREFRINELYEKIEKLKTRKT